MSNHTSADVSAATVSALAALIVALDENGVLPRQRYCDVLLRWWNEMPEEDAQGATGFVFERLLDLLGSSDQ